MLSLGRFRYSDNINKTRVTVSKEGEKTYYEEKNCYGNNGSTVWTFNSCMRF